jgi:hypothetical protein
MSNQLLEERVVQLHQWAEEYRGKGRNKDAESFEQRADWYVEILKERAEKGEYVASVA